MLDISTPDSIKHFFDVLEKGNFLKIVPWNNHDIIWETNGIEVKKRFNEIFSEIFKNANYNEVLFPTFIDDHHFQKQPIHYRDLKSISYKIQGEDKYIRATSESQIAEYISSLKQNKSEIKIFQICTVFRKEDTKNTLPLIRAIEIDPFLESMTFSMNSLSLMNQEIGYIKNFFRMLCIPYIELIRPVWDTFPEAQSTYAFDSYIQDIGWIQIGSIHNLGTSFTKYFKIHYNHSLLNQTSSGISGRALLTAILIHFQNNIIYLPFQLSIKQISIDGNSLNKHFLLKDIFKDFKIYVLENELSNKFLYGSTYNIPLNISYKSEDMFEIIDSYGNVKVVGVNDLRQGILCAMQVYNKTLSNKARSKFQGLIQNEDVLTIKETSNNLRSIYDSLLFKDRNKILLGWRFGNWVDNMTREMVFQDSNSAQLSTSFYFGSNN